MESSIMSEYSEMKYLTKEVLIGFIADHPFQWWASLTFEGPVTQELARKRLLEWTRTICRSEGMQLAAIAVVVEEERRCHLHALILGRNRGGKTLHRVSIERWAKQWWKVNCNKSIFWNDAARIDPVYEERGVSDYLIKRNLIRNYSALTTVFFYNERLLRKSRIKRDEEIPAAKDRRGRKIVYLLRRDAEEYRKVKDHMVSFMEQLEKHKQI
jgi:hypothetical protein